MVATAKTKMIVRPASRMLSAISFGVFCRSAPSTSAIMRSRKVEPCAAVIFTLIQSEITRVPPVTAERSPPLSRITGARFAGDRRFVDRGDAFDHVAVARDQVAGLDQHDVAGLQRDGRHRAPGCAFVRSPWLRKQLGLGFGLAAAQGRRLRLAAAFGHGFGEIGEEHSEPQPEDDLEGKAVMAAARRRCRG